MELAFGELLSSYDSINPDELQFHELSHIISVEDNIIKEYGGKPYLTRHDFEKIFEQYDIGSAGYLDKVDVISLLGDLRKYHDTSNIPLPVIGDVSEEILTAGGRERVIGKCALAVLLTAG